MNKYFVRFFLWSLSLFPICSFADSQVYVLNQASDDITIIETATQSVLGTISFTPPFSPNSMVFSPNGAFAYVLSVSQSKLDVIATQSQTIVGSISLPSVQSLMGITPDGSTIYIAAGPDMVWVDTASMTLGGSIMISSGAPVEDMVITPNGSRVYLTVAGGFLNDYVSIIDVSTQTVLTTISTLATSTLPIAITPNGSYVYVGQSVSHNVFVIDTTSNLIINTLGMGDSSSNIVTNPNGSSAYVLANSTPNYVTIIDATTNVVLTSVSVGTGVGSFISMNITPDGSKLYVCNSLDGTVSVMNTSSNTIIATIPVGTNASTVVFSLDSSFAYILNTAADNVSVINTATNSVIATIPAGNSPGFAAVALFTSGTLNDVAQEAAIRQSLELIYSQVGRSLDDIQSTGLFPTFEGTYPDSINSYIIDSTTPFTIEVNFPPPWCP